MGISGADTLLQGGKNNIDSFESSSADYIDIIKLFYKDLPGKIKHLTKIEFSERHAIYTRGLKATQTLATISDIDELNKCGAIISAGKLAYWDMIIRNVGLVISIASFYYKHTNCGNIHYLELINEGILGLIKAINKFEPERDLKITTYSTYQIRAHIQRYIQNYGSRNGSILRIPVGTGKKMDSVIKELRKLNGENKEFDDSFIEQLSTTTGIPVNMVEWLLSLNSRKFYSFERMSSPNDCPTLPGDELFSDGKQNPAEMFEEQETYKILYKEINKLSEIEKKVLGLRFGFIDGNKYTLQEIADILHITKSTVRAINNRNIYGFRRESIRYLLEGGISE